ncbi:MAG: T9SS type A sorting domain-containing protein [Crocinitomicaceae bacterium]|nr:T9SS type A sorting domain-containing protein [Crocinitomicaceae bacterium]MBK8926734.1 T9SS type A sorting domain-containing protein [Crocinitomicaceae bacterium]
MSKIILLILIFMGSNMLYSQYSPAANQIGTIAVHKDSATIVGWATQIIDFHRGPSDIANGWISLASFGDSTAALGYAEGTSTDVVSLGDSGYITLGFAFPIMNGPGNDFVVFENSFSHDYLELAFVEASSDGIHFVRFPSVSLTQTTAQTGTYATTDTEKIHNLAGKFIQGYGTPFDLNDLIDSVNINIDSIRFIRIVDVVGTIDPAYANYDVQGNIINDPYPTDFASGGFDLDAVAVLNENNIYASEEGLNLPLFTIYPNPTSSHFVLEYPENISEIQVMNSNGQVLMSFAASATLQSEIPHDLEPGIYFVLFISDNAEIWVRKLIVRI